MLDCLREIYFEGRFPLRKVLPEVDDGVFAADERTKELFTSVTRRAKGYFAGERTVFMLDNLVGYIEREYAQRWESLPEGFVAKVLRLSTAFRVRKAEDGLLYVRKW